VEDLEQQQRQFAERMLELLGSLGVVPFEVGSAEESTQAGRLAFLRFSLLASL